uniref:Uncharacterized protein n=1 Tax=candidate division WOR-3 bacterium TaxID=2052148 RepID=A0A7V3RH99_UNCW3
MVFSKLFLKVLGTIPGLFILVMCLFYNTALGQSYVLIDSSGNGYTLWHQRLECISYNPIPSVDALIIVNRAYNPTGNLNTHEAPGNLSAWVHGQPYQG